MRPNRKNKRKNAKQQEPQQSSTEKKINDLLSLHLGNFEKEEMNDAIKKMTQDGFNLIIDKKNYSILYSKENKSFTIKSTEKSLSSEEITNLEDIILNTINLTLRMEYMRAIRTALSEELSKYEEDSKKPLMPDDILCQFSEKDSTEERQKKSDSLPEFQREQVSYNLAVLAICGTRSIDLKISSDDYIFRLERVTREEKSFDKLIILTKDENGNTSYKKNIELAVLVKALNQLKTEYQSYQLRREKNIKGLYKKDIKTLLGKFFSNLKKNIKATNNDSYQEILKNGLEITVHSVAYKFKVDKDLDSKINSCELNILTEIYSKIQGELDKLTKKNKEKLQADGLELDSSITINTVPNTFVDQEYKDDDSIGSADDCSQSENHKSSNFWLFFLQLKNLILILITFIWIKIKQFFKNKDVFSRVIGDKWQFQKLDLIVDEDESNLNLPNLGGSEKKLDLNSIAL